MIIPGLILTITALTGLAIHIREDIRHHRKLRDSHRAVREDIRAQLDNARQHPTITRP